MALATVTAIYKCGLILGTYFGYPFPVFFSFFSRRKGRFAQLFDNNSDCSTFRGGKGARWSTHGHEPSLRALIEYAELNSLVVLGFPTIGFPTILTLDDRHRMRTF